MRRPALLAALAVLVVPVLAGCTPDTGVGSGVETSASAEASQTPTASAESTDPSPQESEPVEPEETSAPTGPQECGQVISTIGETVTVEIIAGDVDCVFAEELLDTYYNDPPSIPEGSGAYLAIGDWECNSSSSQEPGRASTCRTQDGGEIVTWPADRAPSTPASGGYCEQIDQPTLDQLFGDDPYDEQVCETYIGGETAIDQQE
ncbi:hypothetical protein [Ruania rhizosphaerae]|uniref:hypothetical protein n=1 Tax=Ruania rhizosphaerae TaxID=1840413 RepID=UPI0013590A36|nr:hypothetical protein [Ruania rhizosphaerae]